MARTFVIGDIHGCWHELQDLLEAAAITSEDRVIGLGDLVDRGPCPGEVVDFFRTRPNSVALMGNHERKHVRGILSYSQQVTRQQLGEAYADAVSWMAGLPYHFEDDGLRLVHFGHFPGTPLDEVPEAVRAGTTAGERALRERYGEVPWWEHYADEKPIAFGHRVFAQGALVHDGRAFGLDTGVCHGHALTGLLLPERRLVSVPGRADHWKAVRTAWQGPVLRAEPWETWTWGQIAKRLRKARSPILSDGVPDAIGAWAQRVEARIPELADALDARTAALVAEVGEAGFPKAAAGHAAGRWLLPFWRGKLARTSLGCQRPAEVFALADALEVELEEARRP